MSVICKQTQLSLPRKKKSPGISELRNWEYKTEHEQEDFVSFCAYIADWVKDTRLPKLRYHLEDKRSTSKPGQLDQICCWHMHIPLSQRHPPKTRRAAALPSPFLHRLKLIVLVTPPAKIFTSQIRNLHLLNQLQGFYLSLESLHFLISGISSSLVLQFTEVFWDLYAATWLQLKIRVGNIAFPKKKQSSLFGWLCHSSPFCFSTPSWGCSTCGYLPRAAAFQTKTSSFKHNLAFTAGPLDHLCFYIPCLTPTFSFGIMTQ